MEDLACSSADKSFSSLGIDLVFLGDLLMLVGGFLVSRHFFSDVFEAVLL